MPLARRSCPGHRYGSHGGRLSAFRRRRAGRLNKKGRTMLRSNLQPVFDQRLLSLLVVLESGTGFDAVTKQARKLLDDYSYTAEHSPGGPDGDKLLPKDWETAWTAQKQVIWGPCGDIHNDRTAKSLYRVLKALIVLVLDSDTKPLAKKYRKKSRKKIRDFLLRRGVATTQTEVGVTLFDVAVQIEADDEVAKKLVRQISSSKKMRARSIGKCPVDGRKQLYRLSDILSDFEEFLGLTPREKSRYAKALRSRCRLPSGG